MGRCIPLKKQEQEQEVVKGVESELPRNSIYAPRPYDPTRTKRIALEVTRPHFIYDILGYDVRNHGITERWERLLVTNGISQSLIFVELGEFGLQIYQFDVSPSPDAMGSKVEATHFLLPPKNVCNLLRLGEMSFERDSLSNFRQRGYGQTSASFLRIMDRNNFQQVTFLLYDTEIFTTINFIRWMSDYSLFHTEPHQTYYQEDQILFRYLEQMGLLHLWKKQGEQGLSSDTEKRKLSEQEDLQKDLKKQLSEQRKLLEENFRSNRENLIHASILEAEKAARSAEKASYEVAQESLKIVIDLSKIQLQEVAESLKAERERTAKLEAENERLRKERERSQRSKERNVDGLFVGIGDKADKAVDASMTGEFEVIEGELVESSNRETSPAMVLYQEEPLPVQPRKRDILKKVMGTAVAGVKEVAVEVISRSVLGFFK